MIFEKTNIDLGQVKYPEDVVYPIKVTNNSNRVSQLSMQSASCSCTTGLANPNPLQPGQEGVLNMKFRSSKKHRGFKGSTTASFYYTDDTGGRTQQITLNVEVV